MVEENEMVVDATEEEVGRLSGDAAAQEAEGERRSRVTGHGGGGGGRDMDRGKTCTTAPFFNKISGSTKK